MKIYITKQNDTWDLIAFNHYGNENMMSELIDENLSLSHYVIFPAGIKINIPEAVLKISKSLPPWIN